jgi:hypothetical protein
VIASVARDARAQDSYDIVVLPGDGIGVEVAAEASALLELVARAIGVALPLTEIPCGGKYYLEGGESKRDWPEGSEARCAPPTRCCSARSAGPAPTAAR